MLLSQNRPYGHRLRPGADIKLKGLYTMHSPADWPSGNEWHLAWGSRFDFTRWKTQIDLVKSLGGNCVATGGVMPAYTLGEVSQATVIHNMKAYLDYALSQNMLVYWVMDVLSGQAGSTSANITAGAQLCAVLEPYPNVVGIDCVNEIDLHADMSLTAIANGTPVDTISAAFRAATTIPLCFSQTGNSSAMFNSTFSASLSPYQDFYSFHGYSLANSTSGLSTFRSKSWYKPWLASEFGVDGMRSSASNATVTAAWDFWGTMGAQSDSFGAIGFCLADYYSGSEYGMYDKAFNLSRAQAVTSFQSWPYTPKQ